MGRRCLFSLGWSPFSDGVMLKIPERVDVLLHQPVSLEPHLFLLGWLKLNLTLLLDQLILALGDERWC